MCGILLYKIYLQREYLDDCGFINVADAVRVVSKK